MMMETDLAITTRLYCKERYACRLRLKDERFGVLRNNEAATEGRRIADVMTRWLRRCVRDQPVVMGHAAINVSEDFATERRWLLAQAPAFRDVHPDDRAIIARMVDDTRYRAVEVPTLAPPCIHL